jgi:hypothetical protein
MWIPHCARCAVGPCCSNWESARTSATARGIAAWSWSEAGIALTHDLLEAYGHPARLHDRARESGNSTNDSVYTTFTTALTTLTAQRDALVAQMERLLDLSGPGKAKVDTKSANLLSNQAFQLLQAAVELGGTA